MKNADKGLPKRLHMWYVQASHDADQHAVLQAGVKPTAQNRALQKTKKQCLSHAKPFRPAEAMRVSNRSLHEPYDLLA